MKPAQRARMFGRALVIPAMIGIWGLGPGLASVGAAWPAKAPLRKPLELTYVANSGVLVGSGETQVLIDALFVKPNPEYRAPVRLEGDAPGTIEQVRKYYKDLFLLLPGMPRKVFHSAADERPALLQGKVCGSLSR